MASGVSFSCRFHWYLILRVLYSIDYEYKMNICELESIRNRDVLLHYTKHNPEFLLSKSLLSLRSAYASTNEKKEFVSEY